MNEPEQSSMPAAIAGFLLICFAFASFAPMLIPGVKPMDADFKQVLMALTIGAVSYFIGTTRGSQAKDQTIANLKGKS